MSTSTAYQTQIAALPPLSDLEDLDRNFHFSKTTAYALTAVGEIESVTIGRPGKRGSRRWLTASVLAYIERRKTESPKLRAPTPATEQPSR